MRGDLRGKLDYGRINSGTNQDSDYNGNNRTQEFSRSNNKAGGDVQDFSLGLGKSFQITNNFGVDNWSITPLAGFSLHQQHLTMTDGFQTIPASGPFPGLNSSYDAQWQGPWLGIDSSLNVTDAWDLTASFEYHWADYLAQANWNLRPDFAHPLSFSHTAQGRGITFAVVTGYQVNKDWRTNLSAEVQQWHTGKGIDLTYYSDGSAGYYPLNEVHWESFMLNAGVTLHF